MRHIKLTGLQSVAERLAQEALGAREAARGAATAPIGPVSVLNQDGTRTVMGLGNDDGTTMATHVGDVTPPGVPTGITASAQGLLVTISWDGSLQGGIPGDFMWVNLMVDGVVVGHLTHAGSQTVRVREGERTITASSEDDACLPDGRAFHNRSSPCAPITVTAAALPTKEDTRQVAMLVSLTPSGTAAKEATSQGVMPAMEVGLVARCNFSDSNTAPYPTLSIDGGEPQAIMTNGAPFAYWVAGATLTLLWDGSDWQNCSAPVYGATATIGNPAATNVTIDSDSVDFRTGGDHVGGTITRDGASFNDGSLQLGSWHVDGGDGTSLRYATIGTGNTASEFGGLYLTRGAGMGIDGRPDGSTAAMVLERGNDGQENVSMFGHNLAFYRRYGSGLSANLMSGAWTEILQNSAWYATRGFLVVVQIYNITLQQNYEWRTIGRISRVNLQAIVGMQGGYSISGMTVVSDGTHVGYLYVMSDGTVMARAGSFGHYSGQIAVPVGLG